MRDPVTQSRSNAIHTRCCCCCCRSALSLSPLICLRGMKKTTTATTERKSGDDCCCCCCDDDGAQTPPARCMVLHDLCSSLPLSLVLVSHHTQGRLSLFQISPRLSAKSLGRENLSPFVFFFPFSRMPRVSLIPHSLSLLSLSRVVEGWW